MEKRINIAEILKDCPKGMELDCTMYNGVVTLEQVQPLHTYSIKIRVKCGDESFTNVLTEYGQTSPSPCNKCVIFPKGKTTWDGFQRPFKDGDVVINDRGNIFIYKGLLYNDKNRVDFYCGYLTNEHAFVIKDSKDSHFGSIDSLRLATEEEKQKLFDAIEKQKLFYAMEKEKSFYAIKDNGYQGDSKTKTSSKLVNQKFKDGDVVVSKSGCWIGIVKSYNACDESYNVYVAFKNWGGKYINIIVDKKLEIEFSRLATEEEKQKLFDCIKVNGYQWDPETKTLYKSKFKDGDVCTGKVNGNLVIFIYKNRINTTLVKSHFVLYVRAGFCKNCYIALKDEEIKFATEEEKQRLFHVIKDNGYHWNDETKTLEILIKPKFKIGDRIRHKLTGKVYEVSSFLSNGYGSGVYEIGIINELIVKIIDIKEQDNYELLPNKFDTTTLKPFDKVLVRDENGQKWMCDIFSYYDDKNPKYPFWGVGRSNSKQCIPYKGNEHLLGTTNDCDEFYKNW